MIAAVVILAVACAVLAAALVALVAYTSHERRGLLDHMRSDRETLLRAALARTPEEFEAMERTAQYGELVLERARANHRQTVPQREAPLPPEGLG